MRQTQFQMLHQQQSMGPGDNVWQSEETGLYDLREQLKRNTPLQKLYEEVHFRRYDLASSVENFPEAVYAGDRQRGGLGFHSEQARAVRFGMGGGHF